MLGTSSHRAIEHCRDHALKNRLPALLVTLFAEVASQTELLLRDLRLIMLSLRTCVFSILLYDQSSSD